MNSNRKEKPMKSSRNVTNCAAALAAITLIATVGINGVPNGKVRGDALAGVGSGREIAAVLLPTHADTPRGVAAKSSDVQSVSAIAQANSDAEVRADSAGISDSI